MITERANRHFVQISLVTLAVLLTLALPWISDQLANAVVPIGVDPLGHLFLHHGL